MISAVEYFRLWRSLGLGALAGLIAGAMIVYVQQLDIYIQSTCYVLAFIAIVAILARLYVFRPLLVVLVGAILLTFLFQGVHMAALPLQAIILMVGGLLAGATAVWVARPQHFGIAIVLSWAACVVVGLPLTVL